MKLPAFLLVCLSLTLLAQTPAPGIAALQKQGTQALGRERARSKADLCTRGADGREPEIGYCWLREGKTTDANYTAYVRAIGALLRQPAGQPKHLEFDTAEATWLSYRKQTCEAMIAQWEGGTLGRVAYPRCLVTVTWDHMNELEDLYSGLLGGH